MSDYPKGYAQNPFTQSDVDAIKPNDGGVRIMPSGHYAAWSRFGEESSFGAWSRFGEESRFGAWSRFGEESRFGAWSRFGEESSFGARSIFGEGSIFGARSIFGEVSSFGEGSRFEGGRTPDDWTRPFFAVDRIGSEHRKAYFFSFGGVIHVRAGCFFGDESAFLGKLDADGNARKSRQYRAALELARDILGSDGETA